MTVACQVDGRVSGGRSAEWRVGPVVQAAAQYHGACRWVPRPPLPCPALAPPVGWLRGSGSPAPQTWAASAACRPRPPPAQAEAEAGVDRARRALSAMTYEKGAAADKLGSSSSCSEIDRCSISLKLTGSSPRSAAFLAARRACRCCRAARMRSCSCGQGRAEQGQTLWHFCSPALAPPNTSTTSCRHLQHNAAARQAHLVIQAPHAVGRQYGPAPSLHQLLGQLAVAGGLICRQAGCVQGGVVSKSTRQPQKPQNSAHVPQRSPSLPRPQPKRKPRPSRPPHHPPTAAQRSAPGTLKRNMTTLPSPLRLSCSLRSSRLQSTGSWCSRRSTVSRILALGSAPSGIGSIHALSTAADGWVGGWVRLHVCECT